MSSNTISSDVNKFDDESKRDNDLSAAIKELDTFFYRASHDLRTPIIALEGVYNMLNSSEEFKLNPALGLLKKQILKIKGLNESIIEVGIVRSKSKQFEPVNLQNFASKICHQLEIDSSITLEMSISKDIFIQTDASLLEVILKSIIHNAMNYQDINKKPTISISTSKRKGKLALSVIDNGIGINEHLLPKLFTMFFRANVQKSGFGLGLYKSKIAADRLNLVIEVESTEFEGTKASVLFSEYFEQV